MKRPRPVQLWCDQDFRKFIRVQAAQSGLSIQKYTEMLAKKAKKDKEDDFFDFSF